MEAEKLSLYFSDSKERLKLFNPKNAPYKPARVVIVVNEINKCW